MPGKKTYEEKISQMLLVYLMITYLSLDHIDTIASHLQDQSKYVNFWVFPNMLQQPVNSNESPSSTNSSTLKLKYQKIIQSTSLSKTISYIYPFMF